MIMDLERQDRLIETLTRRVGARQESIEPKVGAKISLDDAKQEVEKITVRARLGSGPVDRDRRLAYGVARREDKGVVPTRGRQ